MFKSLSVLFAVSLVGVVMLYGAGTAADAVSVPDPVVDAPLAASKGEQTAVVAGGCFWGVEAVFEHVKGVNAVTSGYAGGGTKPARYDAVSTGTTGHAESVRISYDPSRVTYGQLLKVFFAVAHDPTELNRQGPDAGTQYRSAIFYANDEQKRIAEAYVAQLNRSRVFGRSVVTQVSALDSFHPAEAYHQNYLARHPDEPYIVINDLPKVENLRKRLPELYVSK
jgi:peptide-methionine (S)-S-oxide reductase